MRTDEYDLWIEYYMYKIQHALRLGSLDEVQFYVDRVRSTMACRAAEELR